MELAEAMKIARGDVDAAVERVKADRAQAGSAGMGNAPFFATGVPANNLLGSYGLTTQAAEQYRHYTGWSYSSIKIVAQRIARQQVKIAKKRKRAPVTRAEMLANKASLPGWFKSHAQNVHLIEDHPLIDALNRPNPIMIRWSLMYVTVASLLITGKSVWWIWRGKDGEVQIWPLPTHWCQPNLGGKGVYDSWLIRPFGAAQAIPVPASEIGYFHMPDPGNPLGAVSPLQAQNKSIVGHEFMNESQIRTFLNGSWPGLVITIGATPEMESFAGKDAKVVLTDAQRKDIIAAFKARYRGVYKTDEPIICDDFIKDARRMTNTPREMDWTKSKKDSKEEITQGFGVNPISMGQVDGSNRASSATADDHLCSNTVNPLIELLSEFMTMSVLPMFDQGDGLSVFIEEAKPIDEDLIRQKFGDAMTKGTCTVNEYREAVLGLGPIPNGDVLIMPANAKIIEVAKEPMPTDAPLEPDDATDDAEKRLVATGRRWHALAKHATKEAFRKVWSAHQTVAGKTMHKALLRFLKEKATEIAKAVRHEIKDRGLANAGAVADASMPSEASFHKELVAAMREPVADIVRAGAVNEWELFRPRSARDVATILTKDRDEHPERLRLPSTVSARIEELAEEILGEPYWRDQPEAIRDRIVRELQDGIDSGKSGDEVAELIDELLGGDAESRAMLITRTESTGALNAGHQATREFLAEKGIVNGKEWLCIEDKDTREDHSDADGQVVAVDEPFEVGDEKGMYPGDIAFSAAQRCNCRCTSVSTFPDDDESETEAGAVFVMKCLACEPS